VNLIVVVGSVFSQVEQKGQPANATSLNPKEKTRLDIC
jgi:hypothetical protein